MTKSSNYWDNRALNRLNEIEQISNKHIEAIKEMYNQAFKNIDNEIARIYKNYAKETGLDVQKLKELLTKKETDKVWKTLKRQGLDKYILDNYKSRISRLEQIQAQIYAKAKMIYPKEELEQTMCYKGVINQSYYKAIYDTQIGSGYDFSFNTIDQRTINQLLSEKWSGKNYSQRIWTNTDILAETLSQYVGAALLSGQSIQKTSKQIRDRFNVGKYYSERLVRTETNYFNNQADAMAYQEMGIDKYVFVATLDNRTSEICQEMDNKVFDYDKMSVGENFPPLHPNCRSKTRGYLGEEAEKLLQRRARNPITGEVEVIDNIPYSEWIKKYNEKVMLKNNEKNTTDDKKVMTNDKKSDNISNTNDTINALNKLNIEYINVHKLNKKLTNDEIIEKISGGDETKGSCSSAALAYIGNKNGLNVLDFRGGESQNFFSTPMNILKLCDDLKIKYEMELNYNDTLGAMNLLNKVEEGKEYYLSTGAHATIIRKIDKKLQYLELQDKVNNGFKQFTIQTLKQRFGCKQTHTVQGHKAKARSLLIDINEFTNKNEFKEILGYINTPSNKQMKGENGNAK